MPFSAQKHGRSLLNTSPGTATDQEQSPAIKRRKLNPADSASSKPAEKPGFFSIVGRLRSRFGYQGIEGPTKLDKKSHSVQTENAEEDELAAEESDNGEGNKVARLSTNSSPAKIVSPPSVAKSRGRPPKNHGDGALITPAKPAGKLNRVPKYAIRIESIDVSKESSVDADPLSEDNNRINHGRHQSTRTSNQVVEKQTQPKSILAADKPKGHSKKNVGFEIGKPDNVEGFKDIPDATPATKKYKVTPHKDTLRQIGGKATQNSPIPKKVGKQEGHKAVKVLPNLQAQEDSDFEEDDDVPCVVCEGKDSKKPNEIVFCETCNLAVHQKCYNIPVIPEGDWFCQDCAPAGEEESDLDDQEEEQLESTVDEPEPEIERSSYALPTQKQVPRIKNFEHHFRVTQSLILQKLTGQRRMELKGLDDEYKKVYQVVEQTVTAGESNSMLVIGARGSGKTTLVETVLSGLSVTHRENFHIVRLNGFIHTDDKLALREIWRQLGREMELDEELTGKTNNHADTLASLLALLSHPSELSDTDPSQTSKSVIFILDEFDLFATHSRQTLLYNLFDIAQARKAPIAVLGLTTRIDVVESLEKRVKSRFSHRYVHLSLPKTLSAFWDICKEGLSADEDQIKSLDPEVNMVGWHKFQMYWESILDKLYTKDEAFKQHLLSHFYRTKSIPSFFTTCLLPIASLTPSILPLTGTCFLLAPSNPSKTSVSLSSPDSKLHLIPSLPTLPLTLLIAAARLDIIHDTETCNFSMAYDEYQTLATRHKIQNTHHSTANSFGSGVSVSGTKIWGREVALGAWEGLIECGLLVPVSGVGNGGGGEGKVTKMWRVDVGLEEIGACVDGLGEVFARWCREI